MTTLAWFDTELFTRLGLTFGHFLWQGAAIALVTLVLSVVLRNSSARLRYMFFLAALVVMTICPVITFWFVQVAESDARAFLSDEIAVVKIPADGIDSLAYAPDEILVADTSSDRNEEFETATSEGLAVNSVSNGSSQTGSRWQWVVPYLTVVYLLGVMLLLGRLMLGLLGGQHLRRQSQLIDEPELLSGIARSAKTLGMRFTPTILYCKQVAIPTVVGVFRPAILLPLSLTTGLSPDQIEAVLTHELAHVRRYDHLVNILQRVIESLLFFHPAVWWVSHRIRVERENCCDDIVVALGAEPLGYAACLLDLAERGQACKPSPQLETVAALHAAKSGSLLSHRIRRLVSGSSSEALGLTRGGLVLTLACLALIVSGTVLLQGQIASNVSNNETEKQKKDEPKNTDVEASFDPVTERTLSQVTKYGSNGPRAVVARWMDRVLANNVRDSWALTTKPFDPGLNAQHDLPRLANKDKVRIVRSLGNESVAVVVTNSVKHVESGKDQAFAFWLVRRDGSWLINRSDMLNPEIIEEQLRGFSIGGGGGLNWSVTNDDLVGIWLGGPGKAGGAGGPTCESRFQLRDDGTFTLEIWGPGGRDNGTKVKRGTWRLEEDRIIREQDKQRFISRVSWMGNDSLVLQSADGNSLDGRGGTHYKREKAEKSDSPSQTQPANTADMADSVKATTNVYVPERKSEGKNVILELESGDMLPNPQPSPPITGGLELTRLGRGDLFFDDEMMGLLRGATATIWNKDRFVPLKSLGQLGDVTGYKFPNVPCRLLIKTAEKKQFDVTVLSKTKDGGILLKYHSVTQRPTKSTDADADSKRLQATWTVVAVEKNGDAQPDSTSKFVFHAGHFQIFDNGEEAVSGTFTINSSQNPHTIDLHIFGEPELPIIKGIYDFPSPGKLRLCYGDKPNWRPTRFDSTHDGGSVAVVELRSDTADAAIGAKSSAGPATKPDNDSNKSFKRVHLLNAEGGPGATVDDFLGVKFLLDLDSGQMLAFPDDVLKRHGQPGQLLPANQKRGDLSYAGHSLFCLRGAIAMRWDGNGFVLMKPGDFATSSKRSTGIIRYELTKFPCRLLIITAEKKLFEVNVLSVTDDGGIDLEYREAAGTSEAQKSSGEAPQTTRDVIINEIENIDQGRGANLRIDRLIQIAGIKLENGRSNSAKLPDLFEAVPQDSKSYEVRKEVVAVKLHAETFDGSVYYVPSKDTYYIQRDPYYSSTLTYYGPFPGDPRKIVASGKGEGSAPDADVTPAQPTISIYRVLGHSNALPFGHHEENKRRRILFSDAADGTRRFDSMRPDHYPLEGLILDETPLLTVDDIVVYNRLKHEIYLKPNVRQRLLGKIKPSVWGVPFAVVVKGKPAYLGAFWTGASSYTANMPTILLDAWQWSQPKESPDYLPTNVIRIQGNWSDQPGEKPNDPRSNQRLQQDLKAAGKIVTSRPATTFHVGGKRLKSGTILGKVGGRHIPGEQLKYNVMLEPDAWRNKHGFPPNIVVAAGKAFEFTNVPIGKCKVTARAVTTAGPVAGKNIIEGSRMVGVTVKNEQVVEVELSFSDFPARVTRESEERDEQVDPERQRTNRNFLDSGSKINWAPTIELTVADSRNAGPQNLYPCLIDFDTGKVVVWPTEGLNLTPGTHTVRVAFTPDGPFPQENRVRIVSKPVEIELVSNPKNKKKLEGRTSLGAKMSTDYTPALLSLSMTCDPSYCSHVDYRWRLDYSRSGFDRLFGACADSHSYVSDRI